MITVDKSSSEELAASMLPSGHRASTEWFVAWAYLHAWRWMQRCGWGTEPASCYQRKRWCFNQCPWAAMKHSWAKPAPARCQRWLEMLGALWTLLLDFYPQQHVFRSSFLTDHQRRWSFPFCISSLVGCRKRSSSTGACFHQFICHKKVVNCVQSIAH